MVNIQNPTFITNLNFLIPIGDLLKVILPKFVHLYKFIHRHLLKYLVIFRLILFITFGKLIFVVNYCKYHRK